jgi:hypothetical protein
MIPYAVQLQLVTCHLFREFGRVDDPVWNGGNRFSHKVTCMDAGFRVGGDGMTRSPLVVSFNDETVLVLRADAIRPLVGRTSSGDR